MWSGPVEDVVAVEFPALELRVTTVAARAGPSTPALRDRLDGLSNRVSGSRVIAMRTQPTPRAYRSFFRQIGLDPDVTRTPAEAAAVARLAQGGFRSRDLIADGLLIALVETGVGVWALDAAAVEPRGLGVRTARPGDALGGGAGGGGSAVAPGRLVVADPGSVSALLFEPPAAAHAPSAHTREMVLYAVGVAGVPRLVVDEALWLAGALLSEGG